MKRLRDPKDAVGYGAAVIEGKLWQAYRIHPDHLEEGKQVVARLKSHLQVVRDGPVPVEQSMTSIVVQRHTAVLSEDQHYLGNLCTMFASATSDNMGGPASVLAGAIMALTGHKYFFVFARESRSGTATSYKMFPDAMIDMGAMIQSKLPSDILDSLLMGEDAVVAIKRLQGDQAMSIMTFDQFTEDLLQKNEGKSFSFAELHRLYREYLKKENLRR